MAKIKWDKDDVIKRFQEAIAGTQPGGRPGVLQTLLDKAKQKVKGKPAQGQGEVEEGV